MKTSLSQTEFTCSLIKCPCLENKLKTITWKARNMICIVQMESNFKEN